MAPAADGDRPATEAPAARLQPVRGWLYYTRLFPADGRREEWRDFPLQSAEQ